MFTLDTNTLIYFFKGVGRVGERLLSMAPADVSVPAVVLYELEVGIAKSSSPEARRVQLSRLLGAIQILPFDQAAARRAATVRARLERAGTPIGPYDTLIAGTAMAHNRVLVTHNTAEFGRIDGLQLEDWYGPSNPD